MKLSDYQKLVMRTAPEGGPEYLTDVAVYGVMGELGEAVEMLKKMRHQGQPFDVEAFAEEIGDVLWYLALLAEANMVDLGDVAEANIAKLRKRYPDGFDEERCAKRHDLDEEVEKPLPEGYKRYHVRIPLIVDTGITEIARTAEEARQKAFNRDWYRDDEVHVEERDILPEFCGGCVEVEEA